MPPFKSATATSKLLAIIHGKPGSGKSSLVGNSPKPLSIVSKFDCGLIRRAKVGAVPKDTGEWIMPLVSSWSDLISCLNEAVKIFKNPAHGRRTLVLESLGEFSKLAEADCLESEFDGNFAKYKSYGDGLQRVVSKYIDAQFKPLISQIHRSGVHVLMTCHSQFKKVVNPNGADYDQFVTLLPPAVWKSLEGWVDCVFFANMVAETEGGEKGTRVKAGHGSRMLHTSWSPLAEAKNWLDLDDTIDMGTNGKEAAENFWTAINVKIGPDPATTKGTPTAKRK